MEVGIYIRDYLEDPTRPMHEQIEEAAEVCRRARSLGFSAIYMPQHFIAHPTMWMQPMQMLARLAPDAEGLRLITGILLLTYHNPVDIADQVVTLDHISNGRFTLGVGLGYREKELAAFGTNRKDRVSRMEESIHLMKQLWTGDEITFEGKHWQVQEAKCSLTPVQKPHPPIWMAAQSRGAVRRAARLCEAVVIGPQPTWEDFRYLAKEYNDALAEYGKTHQKMLAANRSITIAKDRETAITEAKAKGEAKAGMYAGFNMQETTTVDLGLAGQREIPDWAVAGNPQDCAEIITRCVEEDGLDYIGLASLNLPHDFSAKLEYLQLMSEEMLPLLPS